MDSLSTPCIFCGTDRPIAAEVCPTCGRGWIDEHIPEPKSPVATPEPVPAASGPTAAGPEAEREPEPGSQEEPETATGAAAPVVAAAAGIAFSDSADTGLEDHDASPSDDALLTGEGPPDASHAPEATPTPPSPTGADEATSMFSAPLIPGPPDDESSGMLGAESPAAAEPEVVEPPTAAPATEEPEVEELPAGAPPAAESQPGEPQAAAPPSAAEAEVGEPEVAEPEAAAFPAAEPPVAEAEAAVPRAAVSPAAESEAIDVGPTGEPAPAGGPHEEAAAAPPETTIETATVDRSDEPVDITPTHPDELSIIPVVTAEGPPQYMPEAPVETPPARERDESAAAPAAENGAEPGDAGATPDMDLPDFVASSGPAASVRSEGEPAPDEAPPPAADQLGAVPIVPPSAFEEAAAPPSASAPPPPVPAEPAAKGAAEVTQPAADQPAEAPEAAGEAASNQLGVIPIVPPPISDEAPQRAEDATTLPAEVGPPPVPAAEPSPAETPMIDPDGLIDEVFSTDEVVAPEAVVPADEEPDVGAAQADRAAEPEANVPSAKVAPGDLVDGRPPGAADDMLDDAGAWSAFAHGAAGGAAAAGAAATPQPPPPPSAEPAPPGPEAIPSVAGEFAGEHPDESEFFAAPVGATAAGESAPGDAKPTRRSAWSQTAIVAAIVVGIVAAWFVVLAVITGDSDQETTAATDPGAVTAAGGTGEPGTTVASTTSTTTSTTTTTTTATTVPVIEPVGDPIPLEELQLGAFALGPIDFGATDGLGRLVASLDQPDAIRSAGAEMGLCPDETGFAADWGPLSAIFIGSTETSLLVGYQLGNDPTHPTSGLTTLSGLQVGDSVADLESIYADFEIAYEDIDGELHFILVRQTDAATLLWGPVTSSEGDGVVQGIYAPRACDAGPTPSA